MEFDAKISQLALAAIVKKIALNSS